MTRLKTREKKEGKKENVTVVLQDLWRDMAAISLLYCLFLEFSLLSISSGAPNDSFLYDNCSKEQISISKARKRLNRSSKIFVVFLLLTYDFMKLCFHSFISQILRLFLTKVS